MFETSILLAFGAVILWGIEDYLGQKSARRLGDFESIAFVNTIGALLILPIVFKDFSLITSSGLLLLLGVAVINFAASMLYFESLKKGKLAVVDVIFEFELPVTFVLGMVFFKEYLSMVQLILLGCILLGVMLIATKSLQSLRSSLEKGALWALATAMLMGVVNFAAVGVAREFTPALAVWFIWAMNAVFCLAYILYQKKGRLMYRHFQVNKKMLLVLSVAATFAWLAYFHAASLSKLAIITAITESYPVIAVSLGILLNKEKVYFHQFLGIAITVFAAIVLGFV